MSTLTDLLFLVNVSLFIVHELDAIQQHEWRFFLPGVDDQAGYRIFTALHVVLFAAIFWSLPFRPFQIGFDVFLLIHAALHWFLRHHPKVTFNNGFSRLWIFGAVPFSLLHLALILTARA